MIVWKVTIGNSKNKIFHGVKKLSYRITKEGEVDYLIVMY